LFRILAAVPPGHHGLRRTSRQALAVTRVFVAARLGTVQFAANGIFRAARRKTSADRNGAAQVVRETGHHEPVWLLFMSSPSMRLAAMRFLGSGFRCGSRCFAPH